MYRLLDLHTCHNDIEITPQCPSAVVDTEEFALSAITPDGRLIMCNRAFLQANELDHRYAFTASIREMLPGLWEQFTASTRGRRHGFKVINLRSGKSARPVGHLLVNTLNAKKKYGAGDLFSMVSADNNLDFQNAYDGLYVATPSADTLKVNPSYEKIAFLSETDLVGRNLTELVEKGYFSRSVTLSVLDGLKKQTHSEKVTLLQTLQCGKKVLVTGMPVFSRAKELTHVLTYVQDLLPLETIFGQCDRQRTGRSGRIVLDMAGGSVGFPAQDDHRKISDKPPVFADLPFVAKAPLTLAAMKRAVVAGRFDGPVLLTGETGVGKDVMAGYIYRLWAGTRKVPFVSVNCSAIPAELLESELFGYHEGAFSGASRQGKEGLFASADGGVLFLNEISEMPYALQAKLLTVLDEGAVRPLGSSVSKPVKVKIICATNQNLQNCIDKGLFRKDLYYRIKVLAIHLSPLRERKEDVLPLVQHFLLTLARKYRVHRYLSPAVQELLYGYHWPGNVRELKNAIELLLMTSASEQISMGDLPEDLFPNSSAPAANQTFAPAHIKLTLKESVRQYEKQLIIDAMQEYGSTAKAAEALGIDPTTLTRKLKRN